MSKCTCTPEDARCPLGLELKAKRMKAHMALLNATGETREALDQAFREAVDAYRVHVELKPPNVVDDRTPEQVRTDGDERWPDGTPYIKDGVCCVCGTNVEQEREKYPVHVCLVRLEKPVPCSTWFSLYDGIRCTGTAYWQSGASRDEMGAVCDKDLMAMLELLPDCRQWLEPALADIRERHLKIGARVRIQCLAEQGQLGTIYQQTLNGPGWYVRPDRRPADQPGIVCLPDELDVLL